MYFKTLYNESRNAIPSWQGYSYQGEVATYKFLEYLFEQFEAGVTDFSGTYMKIEWLEDFIIYESNEIRKIYQVKKTLTQSSFDDVIQNFILQFKLKDDIICKWYIAYDDVDNANLESISKSEYNRLYKKYVEEKIISELTELKSNIQLNYWEVNLRLRNTDSHKSPLPNIRGIIRNLMELDEVKFTELTQEMCEEFSEKHIDVIINMVQLKDDDFDKFSRQLVFSKINISTIKSNSINIINKLHEAGYIVRNDIMRSDDIYNLIYIHVYEKLMRIRNKKTELFTISYDDIKRIFTSTDEINLFWLKMVYGARENFVKELSDNCEVCGESECENCAITSFLNLDFCKLVDHCNLEYPKTNAGTIYKSLCNKLSDDKRHHIIDMLTNYKDKITCLEKNDFVELTVPEITMFVSANISGDSNRNRKNILENINEHIEVYKEYSCILTQNFTDIIDYEQTKIKKNTEYYNPDTAPTFMDILPIKFIEIKNMRINNEAIVE